MSFWPFFMFFQPTEAHRTRGLTAKGDPKTKAGKQGPAEGGPEGMEVDQRARQDAVEGQNSSWIIQKHSYSVGHGRGG